MQNTTEEFEMKKILSLLLCLTIIVGITATVSAAGFADAPEYTIGTEQTGKLIESKDTDVYKFTLENSGTLNMEFEADFEYILVKIYDEKGNERNSRNEHWNSTLEVLKFTNSLELTRGTYYIEITGVRSGYSGRYFGSYKFLSDFVSANETFEDDQGGSNNSVKVSNAIDFDTDITGHIAINDDTDIYSFTMPSSGNLAIKATGAIEYLLVQVYDSNGNEVWSHNEHWNGTMKLLEFSRSMNLICDTYYISFKGIRSGYSGSYRGAYTFDLSFVSANETFDDKTGVYNNAAKDSSPIDINKKYNGQLALNDSVDFYSFTLDSAEDLSLSMNGNFEYVYCSIFDKNGERVFGHNEHWNGTMREFSCVKEFELEPGEYYISFEGFRSGYSGSYTGNYSFSLSNGEEVVEVIVTPDDKDEEKTEPEIDYEEICASVADILADAISDVTDTAFETVDFVETALCGE